MICGLYYNFFLQFNLDRTQKGRISDCQSVSQSLGGLIGRSVTQSKRDREWTKRTSKDPSVDMAAHVERGVRWGQARVHWDSH